MTSFSFFKYFDAFELDVNVVNFVYYGKTRMFKFLNFHIRRHEKQTYHWWDHHLKQNTTVQIYIIYNENAMKCINSFENSILSFPKV